MSKVKCQKCGSRSGVDRFGLPGGGLAVAGAAVGDRGSDQVFNLLGAEAEELEAIGNGRCGWNCSGDRGAGGLVDGWPEECGPGGVA